MKPNKIGQVAKFHSPLPDENPNQLYVVLDIFEDVENPRAEIKVLNSGLTFPPINTVILDELEVVEVDTTDLLGHEVTIKKSDSSQVAGIVVGISEEKILLDMTKGFNGVETNVCLTIQDENGKEHTGTLFVN